MGKVEEMDDARALQSYVGAVIVEVQVLAPNALTTVDPPLIELAGKTIQQVIWDEPHRWMVVECEGLAVDFDLARSGRIRPLKSADRWRPGQPSAPTIRIITDRGSLDFSEPGRTKRIRMSI